MPEIDPLYGEALEAFRGHWAPRALQIFQQAASGGTILVYARKTGKEITDVEINLVVRILDPITGQVTEVKVGALCPPTPYTLSNPAADDEVESFTLPASAAVN